MFWILVLNIIIVPFIYSNKLSLWKVSVYVSTFSSLCMIICVIMTCIIYKNDNNKFSQAVLFNFEEFYVTIPLLFFAFGSFHTIYEYDEEISKRDFLRYKKTFLY